MKEERVSHEFGWIDYAFIEPGILVFKGSYVYKDQRGKGIFKKMVSELFSRFPKGTKAQVPLTNKKIIPFFEEMGFKRVKRIEYWGSPSNAVCMEGTT